MEILGKDLSHYLKIYQKFSLKNILQIASSCVSTMQEIHKKGVIHRDLKPENIMFGHGEKSNHVYIVDFGISKMFIKNNRHISFKENKSFIGTTRYASIAAHKGFEIGRKDDLESLFYVILYLYKGILPWQNLNIPPEKDRTEAVGEKKFEIQLVDLCKDTPEEILKIFEYIRSLEFLDQPDYQLIQDHIKSAAQNNQIELNRVFEWNNPLAELNKPNHKPQNENNIKVQSQQHLFLIPPNQHKASRLSVSGSINQSQNSMQLKFT